MFKFSVRPRKYKDQLDAIYNCLEVAHGNGRTLRREENPNGKLELLAWAYDEIVRLRLVADEKVKRRHLIAAALEVGTPRAE